jgi:hypothetical protein
MRAQLFERPAATASLVLDPPRQEWQPAPSPPTHGPAPPVPPGRVPDLAAFVDALRPAAARLAGPGTCLLVVNAPSALEHALQIVDVPAATLAADPALIPAQAHVVRPAASGRSGPRPPERSGPAAPGRAVAGRPPRPGRRRDRAAAP